MAVQIMKVVTVCLGILCMVTYVASAGCQISSDWADLTMEERLLLSDNVVYGKTKEHRAETTQVDGKSFYAINAVFEVYCVLKQKDDVIPETIIIEQIAPRDGCSGTKKHMQIDTETIVALEKTTEGNYIFHEVMPMLSASFDATRTSLFAIGSTCEMQGWIPPQNAAINRCPICGVANFTSAVMLNPRDVILPPCFVNGKLIGDGTNCNMFSQNVPTNTSTCLPAKYARTCTRIVYQIPTATCECETKLQNDPTGGFSAIGAGIATLPCTLTIFMGIVAFYISL